jgi:hypothetical protein
VALFAPHPAIETSSRSEAARPKKTNFWQGVPTRPERLLLMPLVMSYSLPVRRRQAPPRKAVLSELRVMFVARARAILSSRCRRFSAA